ncbi:glycosyltransferase family 4 protein [Paenibacillus odorifer]|uniref:Glycosyltransferase family 1 protein n=1 Tax=Paenibacillus odorifer TaxID=189426 RepID=A0A1R0XS19_9BACL|nr:glycosyltransferase family 4 protein [Paenibacillus odorifer]OMD37954.1 glycosyltransferase family 1 protein [Paenibacillus odorifer]
MEKSLNKKVLFCATVQSHIKAFHLPYLKWFKQKGWEVHVAASGSEELPLVDKYFDIQIMRSPYSKQNVNAFRELQNLIEENKYDLIHCHTPMGSVLARLAARKSRSRGTKVIYTAHGFHFYKGASILNWIMFYPIEKYLSRYTDHLITINAEDYNLALRNKFKSKNIDKLNGVGIDLGKYKPVDITMKTIIRKKNRLDIGAYILFFAGEFSYRKNQKLLIEAVNILRKTIPNIKLLLAGEGDSKESCIKLTEKFKLGEIVEFLGYREDINELIQASDVIVSSSRQEGLPVNIIEGMACGKPSVVTDVRGNNDLILNEVNGLLVPLDSPDIMAKHIVNLYENRELEAKMGLKSLEMVQSYSIENVISSMSKVYLKYMK